MRYHCRKRNEAPSLRATRLEPTDNQLASLFLATGREDLFHELFRRYKREIYLSCLRDLQCLRAAEEAAREVFVRVHQEMGSWKGASFGDWIQSIATEVNAAFAGALRT